MRMLDKSKNCLGIIDLTKDVKLGDFLIFIENLKLKLIENECSKVDIQIIAKYSSKKKFFLYTKILENYLDISSCKIIKSPKYLKSDYKFIYYPQFEEGLKISSLDSTKSVQNFFTKNGFIPFLSSKDNIKFVEKEFLEKVALNRLVITVHLKNNVKRPFESNANQVEWIYFLNWCHETNISAIFFIIGDDYVLPEILALPNVIKTKEYCFDIVQDLLLIESSDMFMGSCSGPFQIALFSKIPYLVFKNPEHHKEEMLQEIGGSNRFPFSTNAQVILRENETFEIMVAEFNKIYKTLNKIG